MEIFLVWLVLAGGVGALAASRGRSGFGFFLLSAVLSPLVGLIVVLVTENKVEAEVKDRLRKEDQERQLESIRAIAASNKAPDPAPRVVPAGGSVADELGKLAKLRDQGVLTEVEFQAQKDAILAASVAGAKPAADSGVVFHRPPPKPLAPVAMAECPNCNARIPLSSHDCPECKANFDPGSAWSLKPI